MKLIGLMGSPYGSERTNPIGSTGQIGLWIGSSLRGALGVLEKGALSPNINLKEGEFEMAIKMVKIWKIKRKSKET